MGAQKSAAAYLYPTYTLGNAKFILETINGVQLLTFAGTCNPEDCLEDLEAYCVARDGIGEICKGDADYWDLCRPIILQKLDPSLPVRCFGHSLGGSVVAIASLELKNHGFSVLDIYNFGAKRSGGERWGRAYGSSGLQCFRITNRRDPIPMLESWLPHIGIEIPIGESGIPLVIPFHSIDGYAKDLQGGLNL